MRDCSGQLQGSIEDGSKLVSDIYIYLYLYRHRLVCLFFYYLKLKKSTNLRIVEAIDKKN